MKSRTLTVLAAAMGSPLILAGPSPAGFQGLTFVEKPNQFGLLVINVYAQFDEREDDFIFAVAGTPPQPMNVNVSGNGTFYQNPFGGDLAPNPTLFPIYPSLEYDTFVTIGRKTSIDDATGLTPGWPGFGADRLLVLDGAWFVTPDDPQGNPDAQNRVLLMQLSTAEGDGFFGTMIVAGFNNGTAFQEYLSWEVLGGQAPDASLDIKPGICPNPFHPTGNPAATLDAAVMGTDSFDPAQIDVSTVAIRRADGVGGSVNPVSEALEDAATPLEGELCDCHDLSGDGITDLVLAFQRTEMQDVLELDVEPPGTELELEVSGLLVSGAAFTASDCIVFDPVAAADVNGDGEIDIVDVLELLAHWGVCPPGDDCPCDIDADGLVGIADLLLLLVEL